MGIADKIVKKQDREAMLRRSLERIIQLYTDKSHFIYELLQNAEDACAKQIKFIQYSDRLEVLHDGKPFTQTNLQSLCDIGQSDKAEDLNQIGEFGVGFKSVFGICDTVKLYSAPKNYHDKSAVTYEPFAIEIQNFTLPVDIKREAVPAGYTTKFVFPYKLGFSFSGFKSVDALNKTLSSRLKNIGATTLLFMRHLESIEYEIRNEPKISSGVYLLEKKPINDHCTLISAIGETEDSKDNPSYLKFFKRISNTALNRTVDIAFPITIEKDGTYTFKEADNPFISVYFPTETESKLNFIVQGPYRTTPNRSSVPGDEQENNNLAESTASLLEESLIELCNKGYVNLSLLRILPINKDVFKSYSLFMPLYKKVKELLSQKQMLPCQSEGYTSADNAIIARNKSLPEIFDDTLVTKLKNDNGREYKWLPTDLTETNKQYKDLYSYMTDILKVPVIRPEDLGPFFNKNPEFLKARDDEWLISMYKMYETIPSLFYRNNYRVNMLTINLVKTKKNEFVAPYRKDSEGNYLQNVFLPGNKDYSNDITIINREIYSKCEQFFKDILGLQTPNEYEIFVKAYCHKMDSIEENITISKKENSYKINNKIIIPTNFDNEDHISDIKTILFYLNSSDYSRDIKDIIKNKLRIVCVSNNTKYYVNPFKDTVLFTKTKNNILISEYYKNIYNYMFIDYDFYNAHGITYDNLSQLNIIENNIVLWDRDLQFRSKFESCTKGTYYTGLPGKQPNWQTNGEFRWGLTFRFVVDVLLYISRNPTDPNSMVKSQIIVKLLKHNTFHLKGTVYIGGSHEDIDSAYSIIIAILNNNINNSYKNCPCRPIAPTVYDIRYSLSDWNGKWLYTGSNELVAPKDITLNELNSHIYGDPEQNNILSYFLNFKKDEISIREKATIEYDRLSNDKKNLFFELELKRRYGISDADLKTQYGNKASKPDVAGQTEKQESFPANQIKNWDLLKRHVVEMFAFARPVQYETLLRRVRTSKTQTANSYLKAHYKSYDSYKYACQMCHKFHTQIETCQIEDHPKDELDPLHVLLCPTCARLFKKNRNDDYIYSKFMDKLMAVTTNHIEQNETVIIKLNNHEIWFTQTHIAEISELLKLRQSIDKSSTIIRTRK